MMSESNTPNHYATLYKTMTVWIAMCGQCFPGHEKFLPKSKIIYFVLTKFYLLLGFLHLVFCVDSILLLLNSASEGNFTAAGTKSIHVLNTVVFFNRLYVFHRRKEIFSILRHLDKMLDYNMGRYDKKNMVYRGRIATTSVAAFVTVFLMAQSAFFMNMYVYKYHRPPMNSILLYIPFKPSWITAIYLEVVGLSNYIIYGAFIILMTSFLSLIRVELIVLRKELADIFDVIQVDRQGNIFIKKIMYNKGIDEAIESETEWMSEDPIPKSYGTNVISRADNPGLLLQKMQECSNHLSLWIDRHKNVLKCHGKVSKLLGFSIFLNDASVVLMTTSLIFASFSGSHPISLSIYSITALCTLFTLCLFGQQVINESVNVPSDALGKAFFLYPLHMQKALKLIVLRSQNPLQITTHGLFSLSLETYYQVLQLCFSLLSFLAGCGITDH